MQEEVSQTAGGVSRKRRSYILCKLPRDRSYFRNCLISHKMPSTIRMSKSTQNNPMTSIIGHPIMHPDIIDPICCWAAARLTKRNRSTPMLDTKPTIVRMSWYLPFPRMCATLDPSEYSDTTRNLNCQGTDGATQ